MQIYNIQVKIIDLSIAQTLPALTKPKSSLLLNRREIRDLDRPQVSKIKKYQLFKKKAIQKKLSMSPIELTYLKTIADEFANSQKLFKGSWKKEIFDHLANLNTNFNAEEALRAAYKFANGKKPHAQIRTKIQVFKKNIEEKFINIHADKKAIEFMTRLGSQASQKVANPNFPDQHILLLGEHHVGLPQEDGSFLNPPTAWLEQNLEKLRNAGYDTLALEVPYDIDEEAWLEKGNVLWNNSSKEHIRTVKKLRDDALKYFKKNNGYRLDKGMVLFVEKVNNWLLQRAEEKKKRRPITLRDPKKPKTENTRTRWLELARKAEKAGFRIVTTDASKKITHEDNKIIFFFQDIINEIKEKTDGLKLIEEYLVYKRGLTLTTRDLSMAQGLEQALNLSENNVIGLYGANHTKATLANGRTSAQRVLARKNIPILSVGMEFDGMEKEKKYTLLDQRLNIQPHEEPSIISLSDMPFAQSQELKSYRDFQVENHRYKIDLKPNPKLGERAPFDAVMLFATPKPMQTTEGLQYEKSLL